MRAKAGGTEVSKKPLRGQVALVTGAGRRIGRMIAIELARAGASVAVNYSRSKNDALEVTREIETLGVESIALRADVSKEGEVRAMFARLDRRFGKLDLLVNNAAVFFPASWERLRERDWDRILGVNLKGTFFCAQAAARRMVAQKRGQIINISSLGGLQAWPNYAHYCSSKAAVIMLTKCLAKALAPHVLVNSIAPGTILFPGEEAKFRKIIRTIPVRKGGRPEDVVQLAVFLAAKNRFSTGQVFAVDGGSSIA